MADPLRKLIGVRGRLEVEVDGHGCVVEGDGERVVVDLPDEAAFRAMLRGLPNAAAGRGSVATQAKLLEAMGVRVEVRIAGDAVVAIGRGVSPSLPARLIGLGPVDASLTTLLKLRSMTG